MTKRYSDFDELLDEAYPPYQIGSVTFYASDILYDCDPIAYRTFVADWKDSLGEEDELEEEDE